MDFLKRIPAPITFGLMAALLYSSGLFIVFCSLPFLYLFMYKRVNDGVGAILVSSVIIAVFYGLIQKTSFPLPGYWMFAGQDLGYKTIMLFGIFYFGYFIAMGVSLGIGVRHKYPLFSWAARGVGIATLVWIVGLIIAQSFGWDLLATIKTVIEELVSSAVVVSQKAGSAVQSEIIRKYSSQIVSSIYYLTPSLIFIFGILVAAVNIIVARRLFKVGHLLKHIHNIASFKVPDILVWIVIGSGVMFFIDQYFSGIGWPKFLAGNVAIVLFGLYFWQGAAVLAHFVQKLRAPILKMAIYIMIILFFQTIGIILVGLGLADIWVDFRRRKWAWRKSGR